MKSKIKKERKCRNVLDFNQKRLETNILKHDKLKLTVATHGSKVSILFLGTKNCGPSIKKVSEEFLIGNWPWPLRTKI